MAEKEDQKQVGRPGRDMKMFTFYGASTAIQRFGDLAGAASEAAGREIKKSAICRALIMEALKDPGLVGRAVHAAIQEPPSGKARLRDTNRTG